MYWSAILALPFGGILIVVGAWSLINHQEGANDFFKGGILMIVSSVLWYSVSRKWKPKEKA